MNSEILLPSGLRLKNRLAKSAMTEDLSDEYGRVSIELINLYKQWSNKSNLGLLISGNVQVDRRHVERARNVCIDLDFGEQSEYQIKMLKALVKTAKEKDTKFVCQLAHAGRQSNTLVAKKALAPSAISTFRGGKEMAQAIKASEAEVSHIVDKFVYAAKVCENVGFDGVQLHSAHGYLLSSFLNPLANIREDKFGGKLENRASVLLEIIQKIKNVCSSTFSISVKLNSADFQKGGFSVEDAAEVAILLAKEKIDFLELSGGTYESVALLTGKIPNSHRNETVGVTSSEKREAYFLDFAGEVRHKLKEQKLDLVLMVTGGFRTAKIINEALNSEEVDLIGIARPLCVDPSCTAKLLAKEIEVLPRPESIWKLPNDEKLKKDEALHAKLSFAAVQSTLQHNLFHMSQENFVPLSDTSYPNVLVTMETRNKFEKERSLKLKGFKKDDPFVHDHLKPTSKI